MAANDIMPFESVSGGISRVRSGPLNASEAFFVGEPVAIQNAGEITESADNPPGSDLAGIACEGPGATNVNPKTDTTYATSDVIQFWTAAPGDSFITKNYSTDGSTFNDAAPVVANIGVRAGLSLISDSWGFDTNASNKTVRLVDILDDQKASILRTRKVLTTSDTYYVVFAILSSQFSSPTDVEARDAA